MTPDDREQARVFMLKQLQDVLTQVRSTSAMGANFLLGVSVGTLMNLRDLLPAEELAELARHARTEFAECWPDINPGFTRVLDQMISPPKEAPHD